MRGEKLSCVTGGCTSGANKEEEVSKGADRSSSNGKGQALVPQGNFDSCDG